MEQTQISPMPKWILKVKYPNYQSHTPINFQRGLDGKTPEKKIRNAESKMKSLLNGGKQITDAIVVCGEIRGDAGIMARYDFAAQQFRQFNFGDNKQINTTGKVQIIPDMTFKVTKWNEWHQIYPKLTSVTFEKRQADCIFKLKQKFPDMRFENAFIYEKVEGIFNHEEYCIAKFNKDNNVFDIQPKYRHLVKDPQFK